MRGFDELTATRRARQETKAILASGLIATLTEAAALQPDFDENAMISA